MTELAPLTAHFDWRDIIESVNAPQDIITALDDYFKQFAATQPGKHNPCLKCSAPQSGWTGRFTWGMTHGEGNCSECGWPARAYHFIKDSEGKDLATLRGIVLQYHPDFVERRKSTQKTEAAA